MLDIERSLRGGGSLPPPSKNGSQGPIPHCHAWDEEESPGRVKIQLVCTYDGAADVDISTQERR